jgi:hypothetical protein
MKCLRNKKKEKRPENTTIAHIARARSILLEKRTAKAMDLFDNQGPRGQLLGETILEMHFPFFKHDVCKNRFTVLRQSTGRH